MSTKQNKAELKEYVANKKLTEQGYELANTLIQLCNQSNQVLLMHMFAKAIGNQNTFGVILRGAAERYSESAPSVDMRMQDGASMLNAISKVDITTTPDDALTLMLPNIPSYIDASDGEQALKVCSEFLDFASHSDKHMNLAQGALFQAIVKSHPTIAQAFLSIIKTTMLSITDSELYSALSNAYKGSLRYI